MQIISLIALFAGIFLKKVLSSSYEFVPDNDDIFQDCPKQANVVGVNDFFNLRQMSFAYNEGSVTMAGNLTCLWEGIEPTDRIMVHTELYKFQFGGWQPTVLSLRIPDFCQYFLDENSLTYQVWTSNIVEEDRICLNNYGHVYHSHPAVVNLTFELPIKVEGRHKIVASVMAYNKMNVKRKKSLCLEVPGNFFKVK